MCAVWMTSNNRNTCAVAGGHGARTIAGNSAMASHWQVWGMGDEHMCFVQTCARVKDGEGCGGFDVALELAVDAAVDAACELAVREGERR